MTGTLWVSVFASGILGWTWLGYPLIVCLLARARGTRVFTTDRTLPTVTAILATRDEASAVAIRVADFLAADYPAALLDVVVGLDDATPERVQAVRAACNSTRVQVVAADDGGGKAAGLNAAVRQASGEVLVFSDTQQRFAPDAISVMVRRLSGDARLAAVGGALQLPGDRPGAARRSPVEWYWVMERQLRAAEARLHSCVGLSGSIYALWRAAWVPMPAQLILDDVWLPMRLVLEGRRIGYDLDAIAWDARSTPASVEKTRKVRTLTGNFQLMAWLPAVLVPFRNPIWLQFISHKVLRLFTPWLLLIAVVGAALFTMQALPAALLPWVLLGAAGLATAVLVLPSTRTKAVRGARWGWSLQLAILEATLNGMRGRWNVWR